MAHRVAPQDEIDLEDIWVYVSTESGSIETAKGVYRFRGF